MYYYYVTLRTLLSAPVYGILCTSQSLSRYCILCIVSMYYRIGYRGVRS